MVKRTGNRWSGLKLILVPLMTAMLVCGTAGMAQAAVVLFDDFNGDPIDPVDPALWNVLAGTVELTGDSNVRITNSVAVMESDDQFTYGTTEIRFTTHQGGNSIFEYQVDGALSVDDNGIGFNQGNLRVQKAGVITATVPFSLPENTPFTMFIDWTPNKVEVLIDGASELLVTDPSLIPSAPMGLTLARIQIPSNITDIDFVRVNVVPEPAGAVLMCLGGLLLLRRRQRV